MINYNVGGRDLAVFFKPGTRSALGASSIGDAEQIGAAALFDANLDGRKLIFKVDTEKIVDSETNEVIKQIPPEELLRIATRLRDFIGLIFDLEV